MSQPQFNSFIVMEKNDGIWIAVMDKSGRPQEFNPADALQYMESAIRNKGRDNVRLLTSVMHLLEIKTEVRWI